MPVPQINVTLDSDSTAPSNQPESVDKYQSTMTTVAGTETLTVTLIPANTEIQLTSVLGANTAGPVQGFMFANIGNNPITLELNGNTPASCCAVQVNAGGRIYFFNTASEAGNVPLPGDATGFLSYRLLKVWSAAGTSIAMRFFS